VYIKTCKEDRGAHAKRAEIALSWRPAQAGKVMKLYFAPASPFARKVRVLLAEKMITGAEQVEVKPWERPAELLAANPLSQVPTLVTGDGQVLYDSLVICEYLDQSGSGPRLLPAEGPARWQVLRRHALANGLTEQVLHIAVETLRREPQYRSPAAIAGWCAGIGRAAGAFEREVAVMGEVPTLAHIALAVGLEYCDFRAGQHVDWRQGRPALAAWQAQFALRPSMQATRPG
jgi:glutathione S-transferase